MKKKYITGVFAIFAIALLGVGLVSAYQGNPEVQGPDYSEDRHIAMQEAFDNVNYAAWHSLMSENSRHGKVLDFVSEENFKTFVEARNAMHEGNFELAHELKAELGLGQGKMTRGDAEGYKEQKMQKGMKNSGNFGACPYAN